MLVWHFDWLLCIIFWTHFNDNTCTGRQYVWSADALPADHRNREIKGEVCQPESDR